MKKIFMLVGLAGVMAAPTLQATMTITPSQGGTFSYGNGGEFRAVPGGGLPVDWNAYVDSAVNGTRIGTASFQTLCIETTEFFNPGSTYDVVLNTAAVYGDGGGNGVFDPLSKGAAYLYSQFAKGTLLNYNYAYGNARVDPSAKELQEALWYLEGEAAGVLSANMSAALLAGLGVGGLNDVNWKADAAAWEYGVAVMNLWDVGYANVQGHQHQDMLVMVPEPTTLIAGALLLLPFGASTLRMLRRNRKV